MRFMITPRGAGKSTYLFRWLQESPKDRLRVIVYSSQQRADMFYRIALARGMFVDKTQFVSANCIDRLMGLSNIELAVDDVDDVLHALLRHNIDIVTATGELG